MLYRLKPLNRTKINVSENAPPYHGLAEVRPGEVRQVDVRFAEVRIAQVRFQELCSTEICLPKVRPA